MLRRNGSGRLRTISNKPKEDINPMNQVANLVDAMLVLAVGIMLALIVSWNLNLSSNGKVEDAKKSQKQQEAVTSFTEDDLESVQDEKEKEEKDLKKKGEVYYDEQTGTYYIMESGKTPSSGDGDQ